LSITTTTTIPLFCLSPKKINIAECYIGNQKINIAEGYIGNQKINIAKGYIGNQKINIAEGIDNHYGFLQKTGQIETKGHHPLIVKI
jgi:hypothetical protein